VSSDVVSSDVVRGDVVSTAVILTGGPDYAHSFVETGPALAAIVESTGRHTILVDDPDALPALLADSSVDVLVVNALRWRMLAERYAQWRDDWAYDSSDAVKEAITTFVRAGGGLVGNHTATICFDDWPEWADVMGGGWIWDVSSHPPLGNVTATLVDRDHPVTRGVSPTFTLDDEVYGDLRLLDIDILATARRTPDDRDQPVVWTHRYGAGRVAYVCFGHDTMSLRHPDVSRLISQSVDWATTTD
jgi:hypothetical protein